MRPPQFTGDGEQRVSAGILTAILKHKTDRKQELLSRKAEQGCDSWVL
jgi:hypothetical protein